MARIDSCATSAAFPVLDPAESDSCEEKPSAPLASSCLANTVDVYDPTRPCFEQSCDPAPSPLDPRDEAIARASLLLFKGDRAGARELLLASGDALAKDGRLEEARKVYVELTRPPLASAKVNLTESLLRGSEQARPGQVNVFRTGDGNEVRLDPSRFGTTTGALGKLKLAQLELQGRMEKVAAQPVDPLDADQARAYFSSFAKTHSNAEVAREYGTYLQAFYAHAGEGVDFSYLTEHILGGLKNEQEQSRFNVVYASRQGHVITGVVDPAKREVFTVNNDQVGAPQHYTRNEEAVNVLGQSLVGDEGTCIFGVGLNQSTSQPQSSAERYSPPKVGSLVWVPKKGVVGTVDEQVARDYVEYSRKTGLQSEGYGGFLEWLAKQPKRSRPPAEEPR